MKINLGCGWRRRDGWENVDCWSDNGKNTVVDFEKDSLPYETDSAEELCATDVLEHISNLIPFMNECHRVLHADGMFYIEVPRYPHADCFRDPTHVRFFTDDTIPAYFCLDVNDFPMYGIKQWYLVNQEMTDRRLFVTIRPRK